MTFFKALEVRDGSQAQQSEKSAQGASWEALNCNDGLLSGDLGPTGSAFSRASTLYQGTKGTKYKVQRYKVTRQVRKGNKAILRDLTRPKAKGLANFL